MDIWCQENSVFGIHTIYIFDLCLQHSILSFVNVNCDRLIDYYNIYSFAFK